MVSDPRFDTYAADYDATVQRAIRVSGESVQYFADLKVRLMRAACRGRPSQQILDFGCGVGNTSRSIAAHFPGAHVTGVDVSAESLSVARGLSDPNRIEYVRNLGGELPFDTGTFEVAFTACVFHHVEPPNRLHWARELFRVVAPGGLLFVFEHNPLNPLTVRVVRNVPFDQGVSLLSSRETVNLLNDVGFTTKAPHYYFFFPSALRLLRGLEPFLHRIPLGAQYFVTGEAAG